MTDSRAEVRSRKNSHPGSLGVINSDLGGPTDHEPVLELRMVTKLYDSQPPVIALDSIDLTIDPGELVAIVGPSGSGKTTMLHVMGTLDRPTYGNVFIAGTDVTAMSEREVSGLRATKIGLIFQNFYLAEHETVLENVADGLLYSGMGSAIRRESAHIALDKVGISHRASFLPSNISGGERQRVAIARALVGNPAIVLADEPTGNLDSKTGANVVKLLRDLNQTGATIAIITHDRDLANDLPRQVEILDGKIVADRKSKDTT